MVGWKVVSCSYFYELHTHPPQEAAVPNSKQVHFSKKIIVFKNVLRFGNSGRDGWRLHPL